MAPGLNGSNSGAGRESGAPHPTGSLGTIPKVKGRKKVPGQPNANIIQQPESVHQIHPQPPQQFLPWIHQQSALNGQFLNGCNIGLTSSNGLPQTSGHKNIPKNLLSFDWQSGEVQSSPKRNCRNRQASSELYDSDESVSQDNRHIVPIINTRRGIISEVKSSSDTQPPLHFHRIRMNGHDASGAAAAPASSDVSPYCMALNNGATQEQPSINIEINNRSSADAKKINMTSSPDRAQVANRLSQIQDYIRQTSSLIESYQASGMGNTDISNTEFLKEVLKDLYDSEAKLTCLLSAFDQITTGDNVKGIDETSSSEAAGRFSLPHDQFSGADHSQNAMASATKPVGSRKPPEIKKKFEEVFKLQALQAEQALLIQKRNQAQEQLQEAQRARNILLARSSGRPSAQGDSSVDMSAEDQVRNAVMNNTQDASVSRGKKQTFSNAEGNQVSSSRESVIRNKQAADSLPADVSSYLKELMAGDEVKEQASSEDSAVEDAIDEYAEARAQVRLQGQIVQDKVSEINALRAQLDQAKSLLNLAHRRPDSSENLATQIVAEQAVNIQRQRQPNEAVCDLSDSKKSNTSSKQQLLDHERAKLGRLRELLATVQEYRSSGLPIPEHIMNEFGSEAQSNPSPCTSPTHTTGSHQGAHEEDAALEADVEEDDEPESTMPWSQQHMSLVDSASMANELSQGLQQRAVQLQIERDSLAAVQRQLDGLFNQLKQHEPMEKLPDSVDAGAANNTTTLSSNSPSVRGPRNKNAQEIKKVDGATLRRIEMLSEVHSRWQQLQDDIASDAELNAKAAPVLSATQNALTVLASHFIPKNSNPAENTEETIWDQETVLVDSQARRDLTPRSISGDHQVYDGYHMSSAPSTLMRRKSPSDTTRNQRAVWSSAGLEDSSNSVRGSVGHMEENQPIVSMPSSSPSILQQQTREMQNCVTALGQSCQSLFMDGSEGIGSSAAMPLLPTTTIPLPPPLGSSSHDREAYYQQLLAAGQLQQHQVLLTAVNQCFHILKLQQNELQNLNNSVRMLSTGTRHMTPMGMHPGVHSGVHPAVDAGAHRDVHPGVHPAVHPGLIQGEEQWPTPSQPPGPPTLNNQVPPGNRTNNYWDNFRSYSRQNLLSTSAKSNEGLSHSPSPLVERSHNSLRTSTPMPVPGPSSITVSSALPQYHTLSAAQCLPAVAQQMSVVDSSGIPIGAVGPAPLSSMDFSLTSPLVQNISRKDKRNIDHADGGLSSPRRRSSNEIDHRTASKALEEAALPFNSQMLPPTSQDFEVPSMPILRNSVASLQSRLNQVNFNGSPSFTNLQDFIETQNTRHQLNNEGVPFSEIASPLSNQQFNQFGGICSLDHTRESTRRLNMDFYNGTGEEEASSPTVLKRNTGAIKRTHTSSQSSASNTSAFTANYQRNIHTLSAAPHLSSSNSSNNSDTSNMTQKVSSMLFPISNSDSDSNFKSAKLQSSQESARNFNPIGRRPGFQDDFQIPSSPTPAFSRSRMRDINETDDHAGYCHDDTIEYEDGSALRGLGFNNCQSSTSSQSSSSQNTSNVELLSFGSGKNQFKENGFQVRKCPKFQTKSGSRSPLPDTPAAASGGLATGATQNGPSHPSGHCPSSTSAKAQTSNHLRSGNKNNQDLSTPNQLSGQGQLFEELRESVFAEMTSLISANESRPQFFVHLLRDLQHISSDAVRQSVLQLIQQALSRYQVDLSSIGQARFYSALDEAEEDKDEANCIDFQRLEKERLPFAGACSSPDLKTSVSSTQEGETLMQLVLGLELAAVLSGRSEEICSPLLIDDVRSRILQLIPSPSTGSASNYQTTNSTRSVYFLHSQIDSILESIFVKFQGHRIGEVRNEITSCVISALPIKLMYRSMVDFYSRNSMETEGDHRRDGSTSFRSDDHSPSVHPICRSAQHYSQHSSPLNTCSGRDARDAGLLGSASNGDLAEADQSHHSLEAFNDGLDIGDGDGDSEADRDHAAEGSGSASGSEPISSVYQLNGAPQVVDSEPEVEALQDEQGATGYAVAKNDLAGAVGGVASVEENGKDKFCSFPMELNAAQRAKQEVNEQWSMEQECDIEAGKQNDDEEKEREREQGLDQVPTRLACDTDRDQENGEKHRSHHLAMPPNDPDSS